MAELIFFIIAVLCLFWIGGSERVLCGRCAFSPRLSECTLYEPEGVSLNSVVGADSYRFT
jgi:hypothetical protein